MDKNDPVWQTFVDYRNLVGAESRELGLDIFGTDQITNMAISLTQAHATMELRNEIRALFAADGEMKGQC
tara:strand:- start:315 stop:524 length:210 start_codon:yes stop_codon:yes gene_type:complete